MHARKGGKQGVFTTQQRYQKSFRQKRRPDDGTFRSFYKIADNAEMVDGAEFTIPRYPLDPHHPPVA